jgi:hypothetical protein
MFRANAHPAWGPPAMVRGFQLCGARQWALRGAAARTTLADRASMSACVNMPAWRMVREATWVVSLPNVETYHRLTPQPAQAHHGVVQTSRERDRERAGRDPLMWPRLGARDVMATPIVSAGTEEESARSHFLAVHPQPTRPLQPMLSAWLFFPARFLLFLRVEELTL